VFIIQYMLIITMVLLYQFNLVILCIAVTVLGLTILEYMAHLRPTGKLTAAGSFTCGQCILF